jgi:hypothetical protein
LVPLVSLRWNQGVKVEMAETDYPVTGIVWDRALDHEDRWHRLPK